MKAYWLMKSEPSVYSIEDLEREEKTYWDGVRNYQARNFMRDQMKPGDQVLYYHSNAEPSGVAGIAEVCKKAYPDFTAWDKKDAHYDPASTRQKPVWYMVDVRFIKKFLNVVSLDALRQQRELNEMMVLKKGCRLSVQPVSKAHFEKVLKMGQV